MQLLYSLATTMYFFVIRLASVQNTKARNRVKGAKNAIANITKNGHKFSGSIWFHASSVGEFEQARPLMDSIKQRNPNQKIILSFFSPSGYLAKKNYPNADYIFYLPNDTKKNVSLLLNILKPKALLVVKYEFWYFLFNEALNRNIPLFSISAIFRKDHFIFKPYGAFLRNTLKRCNHIFVQNNESLDLLNNSGFENATLAGDTRFDRVIEIANQSKSIPYILDFVKDSLTVIAGSVWPNDEQLFIRYINEKGTEGVKYIFAPHEINDSAIEAFRKKLNVSSERFSTIESAVRPNFKVLIIDNIGMLSRLYHYADVAYIGGGFGSGIHNTLEAAVYGIPVVFGPNYRKFSEAVELLACSGGYSVANYNEFNAKLDQLLTNKNDRQQSGKHSAAYVSKKIGATQKILNNSVLKNILNN